MPLLSDRPVEAAMRGRAGELLFNVDRTAGRFIEAAQLAHHRRRLRRLGWSRAFASDGWWGSGEPTVRGGNAVEILVDGSEVLPRIVEALRSARSHAAIAGWHVELDFALNREEPPLTVRQLFTEVARRVPLRVLMWAGVPLRLPTPFFPSRNHMRSVRDKLSAGSSVRFVLDPKERPLHCHHEKLVIVDDELAFVGGMDLTTLGGDRNDFSHHPVRDGIGWHDATARLRGPIVRDVADHFSMRWREVTGEVLRRATMPAPVGSVDAQLVRTIPEKVYGAVERGDFRVLEAYMGALSSARRTIYLESQFLWSPEVVGILIDKLRHPPADDFRLVVVLPCKAESGADDTLGQLGALVEADDGAGRFLACCLFAHDRDAWRPVYVHAKVGIVDDRWLTIGSANLNEHSFYNDTELNVVTDDAELATATRHRLWAEHLERSIEEVSGDPTRVVDHMLRPTAHAQLERMERGLPPTARLVLLKGVSRSSKRLLGPLQSLLVDA